jgi:peptide/nickel transport system permease protein
LTNLRLFITDGKAAIWGFGLFFALLVICLIGPYLSPHETDAISSQRYSAPSSQHWFGTDKFGRDVFTRVLVGGQISLGIGVSVVVLSLIVGSLYGAISGYMGGWLDSLLMRLVDVLLSFPLIFLAVICMALFGGGIFYLILILSLTSWMDIARLVRAEVLSIKNRPFTTRAKSSGLGSRQIILKHIVPNTFPTLSAVAIVRMADIILIESSLSFIGLGVQAPLASWGAMINDGRMTLSPAWWISLFPGLAIILATLSLHIMGDNLKTNK